MSKRVADFETGKPVGEETLKKKRANNGGGGKREEANPRAKGLRPP